METDKANQDKVTIYNNIKSAYDSFRAEELEKTKEQIFYDYYQIHFYSELKEFFNVEARNDLSENCYRYLAKEGKNVLPLLYDYYLSDEYASIDNWESISDFIYNYCERYHEKDLYGGNELE